MIADLRVAFVGMLAILGVVALVFWLLAFVGLAIASGVLLALRVWGYLP